MPVEFSGTPDQRRARLEARGQRCDGNNRRCVKVAVERITSYPALHGLRRPDSEPTTIQTCSGHRAYFTSGNFDVIERRPIPSRQVSEGERRRAAVKFIPLLELRGARYQRRDNGATGLVVRAVPHEEGIVVIAEDGSRHLLADVELDTGDGDGMTTGRITPKGLELTPRFSG